MSSSFNFGWNSKFLIKSYKYYVYNNKIFWIIKEIYTFFRKIKWEKTVFEERVDWGLRSNYYYYYKSYWFQNSCLEKFSFLNFWFLLTQEFKPWKYSSLGLMVWARPSFIFYFNLLINRLDFIAPMWLILILFWSRIYFSFPMGDFISQL